MGTEDPPPADALALAEARTAARAGRDFAEADRLRDRLSELGWTVADTATGPVLSRRPAVETYASPGAVPDRRAEPARLGWSVCLAVHGWPEDVRRLVMALAGAPRTEVLCVDVSPSGLEAQALGAVPGRPDPAVRVVRLPAETGQAEAWTVAARLAAGRTLFFAEPSLEFGPSVLAALDSALDREGVGAAGPFGLDTDDMREFRPSTAEHVAALEYLIAVRREDLRAIGEFDPGFRFYRILDIDFSYQVRAAGLAVVAVATGPVARHEHRLWESTDLEERERLSRRNFRRFLDRWGP